MRRLRTNLCCFKGHRCAFHERWSSSRSDFQSAVTESIIKEQRKAKTYATREKPDYSPGIISRKLSILEELFLGIRLGLPHAVRTQPAPSRVTDRLRRHRDGIARQAQRGYEQYLAIVNWAV